jgi:hypothetical protein
MRNFLVITVLLFASISAFPEIVQVGGIADINGCSIYSIDARKSFGNFTVELSPSLANISVSDPKITVTSSSSSSSASPTTYTLTANVTGFMVQAGGYYAWYKPTNINVYSGLKLGLGELSGTFSYDTYKINGTCTLLNIQAVGLGADIKIPGIDNLVLTTGIGIAKPILLNITGTVSESSTTVTYSITPGTSGLSTFIELGSRIIF